MVVGRWDLSIGRSLFDPGRAGRPASLREEQEAGSCGGIRPMTVCVSATQALVRVRDPSGGGAGCESITIGAASSSSIAAMKVATAHRCPPVARPGPWDAFRDVYLTYGISVCVDAKHGHSGRAAASSVARAPFPASYWSLSASQASCVPRGYILYIETRIELITSLFHLWAPYHT